MPLQQDWHRATGRACTRATPPALIAGALAILAIAAGCGAGDSSDAAAGDPAPPRADFPTPHGETLDQLLSDTKPADDLVASPSTSVLAPGRNRFGFGVFKLDRTPVSDAQAAVYAAHGAASPARGPYPARIESLETPPEFQARTTADDPNAATVVYVTDVDLDQPGEWQMAAMFRNGDQLSATRMPSAVVHDRASIPGPGDEAPRVHTETTDDVGDVGLIDTRDPHSTMHADDLADVLGKEPVVLLFATPALCQSRVCGPVVDVAEQVKSERGDDAAFIHEEIYRDNDPSKPVRPQVAAYGLPTEPWLFVIDRNGRVSTRIEGAFSADELNEALDKVSQ